MNQEAQTLKSQSTSVRSPQLQMVKYLTVCFSKILCNFIEQQIQNQSEEIALIEQKILQYERTSSRSLLSDLKETSSEIQDPCLDEKRRCGRPVTNIALEQQVMQFLKYFENRGLEVNRPVCRLVISQVSGKQWSYGWSRKFMDRYQNKRIYLSESNNINLAEKLYEMALSKEHERNSPRSTGKRKKKRKH